MGGAAVFYNIKPLVNGEIYLSDFNGELVNTYIQVRDNLGSLLEELKLYRNEKEFYELIRGLDRYDNFKDLCQIKRAARFIFLNRTAFNGIWRVNKRNQFNVPFGRYKGEFKPDIDTLTKASLELQAVSLVEQDFTHILDRVQPGDFVYLDPPYVPISKTSAFTSYTNKGFDSSLQNTLLEFCIELGRKGVNFMQSNSSADEVYSLYEDFYIYDVMASRVINSKGSGRAKVKEVIITNYKKG